MGQEVLPERQARGTHVRRESERHRVAAAGDFFGGHRASGSIDREVEGIDRQIDRGRDAGGGVDATGPQRGRRVGRVHREGGRRADPARVGGGDGLGAVGAAGHREGGRPCTVGGHGLCAADGEGVTSEGDPGRHIHRIGGGVAGAGERHPGGAHGAAGRRHAERRVRVSRNCTVRLVARPQGRHARPREQQERTERRRAVGDPRLVLIGRKEGVLN